jgi:hypothetical protein
MTPRGISMVGKKADFVDLPGLGLGMLLQIQFEGLGSSQSRLVGMDYGNFLIIQTPPIADIGSQLYEKNHGIIRYLFSGYVYAFRCTLLSMIKEPYRLSILSYPESVEHINIRKSERLPCIIAAGINFQGRLREGIVSNISMGGCSFEFNQSSQQDFSDLKIKDEVFIALRLRDPEETTVFNAILREVQIDKTSVTIGFQFVPSEFKESNDKAQRELGEYLLTLQNP